MATINRPLLKRLLDLHLSGHPVPPPVLEFVLDEISQILVTEAKITMMRVEPPGPSITQRHRQPNEK